MKVCQIHVTAGESTILYTKEAADALYYSNGDGLGFVDFDNPGQAKKIVPATFDEAWAFLEEHVHGKRGVVHWRMRTSGALDVDRVHPYIINDEFYLIHNGVMREWESERQRIEIPGIPARDASGFHMQDDKGRLLYEKLPSVTYTTDDKSDTQNLAEWLAPLLDEHPGVVMTTQFQHMIGKMIGSGNRLVIVNRVTGQATIINERTGDWCLPGIWQANTYAGDYVYVEPSYVWQGYTPAKTVTSHGKKGRKGKKGKGKSDLSLVKRPTAITAETSMFSSSQKVTDALQPRKLSKLSNLALAELTTFWRAFLAEVDTGLSSAAQVSKYGHSALMATRLLDLLEREQDDRVNAAVDAARPGNMQDGIEWNLEEDEEDFEVRPRVQKNVVTTVPDYPSTAIRYREDIIEWLDYFGIDKPNDLHGALRTFALGHPVEHATRLDSLEDQLAVWVSTRSEAAANGVKTLIESLLRAVMPAEERAKISA